MCKHKTVTIGECRVCTKCGATLLSNGKIFFDRKMPNYMKGKGKKK